MITKTIYIRYFSNYNWVYLVPEDYVEEFNMKNISYLDSIWNVGSFDIEIDNPTANIIKIHLECIKAKIFNEMCFIYIPTKSTNPNPTIKDYTIPHATLDTYPTITIDNFGNPPTI